MANPAPGFGSGGGGGDWLRHPAQSAQARWGPAGVTALAVVGLVTLALAAGAVNRAIRAVAWGLIAALLLVWAYRLYGVGGRTR